MHVHYISIHDGRKNKMIWALFSVHWRRVENSILCTSFIRSLAENSAHLIFGPLCFGPSVLWRCWWGGRKGIWPVKKLSGGVLAQFLICLEQVADLHMSQLMPLPLTVSCFSKIQIGFTFLVPAHPGSPGKRAIKWCVCDWIIGNLACINDILQYFPSVVDAVTTTFCLYEVTVCHSENIEVLSYRHHRCKLLWIRNGFSECCIPKDEGLV